MHKYLRIKLDIGVHKYVQGAVPQFKSKVVGSAIADVSMTMNELQHAPRVFDSFYKGQKPFPGNNPIIAIIDHCNF